MVKTIFYFFPLVIQIFPTLQEEREETDGIAFPISPLPLIRELYEMEENELWKIIDGYEKPSMNYTNDLDFRIGGDDIERSAVKTAKLAKCMPEMKIVPLAPESDPESFYYPSCTRVERCGGCCGHRLVTCQPAESEIIQLSVLVADYGEGRKLRFRKNEIISVERHTKCKCGCVIQPENCTKHQKYNPDDCSCECQNLDDKVKCLADKNTKLWDDKLCACTCKFLHECASGFSFDPFYCRCERNRRRNLTERPWRFDFKEESGSNREPLNPPRKYNDILKALLEQK